MIQMTNEWELLGDFSYEITQKGKKDRIVLGTSADAKNGEMNAVPEMENFRVDLPAGGCVLLAIKKG